MNKQYKVIGNIPFNTIKMIYYKLLCFIKYLDVLRPLKYFILILNSRK